MIDPHYRTIEGFLTLMQKEWCSFGHKFEDRLGTRRSHHKEVSPVCLQFLDCVWQLQRQFPTAFEYSGQFVTFISQCMYSGLFLNFRRNSERDRSQLMRNVGPFEDMQTDDFDFSTLSGYTNLLLRTSNQAALMLNPSYVPPKPSQKNVSDLFYALLFQLCYDFKSSQICLIDIFFSCVRIIFTLSLSALLFLHVHRCTSCALATGCTTWSCGRMGSADSTATCTPLRTWQPPVSLCPKRRPFTTTCTTGIFVLFPFLIYLWNIDAGSNQTVSRCS